MSAKKVQAAPNSSAGKFLFLGFIILAVVIVVVYFLQRDQVASPVGIEETASGEDASQENLASEQGTAGNEVEQPNPAFTRLIGRWLREDGGYVVEISEIKPDGNLTAAYYNPSPIHVSKAAAVEESGGIKVGIELNDVNYPGCLYTLVFNPALDQLQGTYFQAALGQTFPVVFIRMPIE